MTDADPDDGALDDPAPDAAALHNAEAWIDRAPVPDGPVEVRVGVTVTDHAAFRASVLRRLRSPAVDTRARALDDARAYRRALGSPPPPDRA